MGVKIETTNDGGYKLVEQGAALTGLEHHLAVQAAWQEFLQTPKGAAIAKQITINKNPAKRTVYP